VINLFLWAWLAGQAGTSDAAQHLQAGLDARKQRQTQVEIAEFRKATELDPNLVEAFVNLGEAYMEDHDYGAAIAPLKRALEINPNLPTAELALGYALLAQGARETT
jgi:tetratricopeptide (TPR) repeat protein